MIDDRWVEKAQCPLIDDENCDAYGLAFTSEALGRYINCQLLEFCRLLWALTPDNVILLRLYQAIIAPPPTPTLTNNANPRIAVPSPTNPAR